MSGHPKPYMLFKPYSFLGQSYAFTIHGNPVGTPFQVKGTFSKRLPLTTC